MSVTKAVSNSSKCSDLNGMTVISVIIDDRILISADMTVISGKHQIFQQGAA